MPGDKTYNFVGISKGFIRRAIESGVAQAQLLLRVANFYVDNIYDKIGTGGPTFPNGLIVGLITEETADAGIILSGELLANDGVSGLKTKIVELGDWNMDTTATLAVAHGLTLADIRCVTGIVRNDAATHMHMIPDFDETTGRYYCNL